jgi:hypothetical protein
MKIKMLESVSTVTASYDVGKEYDLPDTLAKQWLANGTCNAVAPAPKKRAARKAK